jgi:hypothetical protein
MDNQRAHGDDPTARCRALNRHDLPRELLNLLVHKHAETVAAWQKTQRSVLGGRVIEVEAEP